MSLPALLGEKRGGEIYTSLRDGQAVYECTYYYTVRGVTKEDSRKYIVENTTGLPKVNESVDDDNLGVCSSVRAVRREDNPLIWDVTAIFESIVEQGNSVAIGADPLAWIPRRRTIFFNKDEVRAADNAGTAYKNSAGQALVGIPPIKRTLVAWRFVQFESASVTDETIADRNETVNSTTFKGKAAKTLLLTVEDSEVGTYYGQPLRLTQYLLKYDPKDWRTKMLDVGTVYKSGTTLLPYTDAAGNVIEGGLNGSGAKVTGGNAPSILYFDDYATSTFSFLRI